MSVTTPRGTAGSLIANARRYWWLAVALFAVVAAGSLWRAHGPGASRSYVSTASFYVLAAPPSGAASSYDRAVAQERAVALARTIAQGSLFHDAGFEASVVAQLSHGDAGSQPPTAGEVASALSATHTGPFVTLTARWPTPFATTLATAAQQALQHGALPGQLLPTASATSQVAIQPAGSATMAVLDSGLEAARVRDLAFRLVGGALIAMVVALTAGWLTSRRTTAAGRPSA